MLYSSPFAQQKSEFLSSTEYSIYGGLSFVTVKNGWGAFQFEGRSHLTENILMKFTFGYTTLTSGRNYEVNSYSIQSIQNDKKYFAVSYEVEKIDYKIIPISIGLQYKISKNLFDPYTFFEVGYNLIDPHSKISSQKVASEHQNFGEIPLKNRYIDRLPNGSYKLAIGVGIKYPISDNLAFDIRYSTQFDSEILNFQQLLFGVSI